MISLDTDRGKVLLEDDCLLVFIDETGGESLSDPNCPIFGLGGCAMVVSHYEKIMKLPWNYMKDTYFSGSNKNLHATDLIKPNKNQIDALNHMFLKFNFARFAVTLGDKTILKNELESFQIVSASLWEHILNVAKYFRFSSLAIIFEDSQRGNPLFQKHFSQKKIYLGKEKKEIEIMFCIMAKNTLEAGLEIADFVIHTAGRQARKMNLTEKKKEILPDFDCVFRKVDERIKSYIHITSAQHN